ncbi:MAG: twin-arginine translocation signal domain-containing protein, partial [Olsenella sp.]|nr:twin-arginine translocation signal domain-containing protein [Olsenella sp.]
MSSALGGTMNVTRRNFLTLAGAASALGLAACGQQKKGE